MTADGTAQSNWCGAYTVGHNLRFLQSCKTSPLLRRYKREDGLDLTATLYLPPGYDKDRDGRLPCLLWAYPREFKTKVEATPCLLLGRMTVCTKASYGDREGKRPELRVYAQQGEPAPALGPSLSALAVVTGALSCHAGHAKRDHFCHCCVA